MIYNLKIHTHTLSDNARVNRFKNRNKIYTTDVGPLILFSALKHVEQ